MLGNLSSDIMGTNPQCPKIVNHDWLDVDLSTYDNYPSENERLRVLPQIAEQWGHNPTSNMNLIPNMRIVPFQSSDKSAPKEEIVKASKKAMMIGLTGTKLADYLRVRFSKKDIEACSSELSKISEEQGLLGNVYVDSSVFKSAEEATAFIRNNSCRLAKYVIVDPTHSIYSMENVFKKKAVNQVEYNQELFDFYRSHLVAAGRIPENFEINSKESLKRAFLFKKGKKEEAVEHKEEKPLDIREASLEIASRVEAHASDNAEAQDALRFRQAKAIVAYAQELIHQGKTRDYIKEALRTSYTKEDLMGASPYLTIVASEKGLTAAHLKELFKEGRIGSVYAYHEMEHIANQFKAPETVEVRENKFGKQVGVKGFLYAPKKETSKWASDVELAMKDLRGGVDEKKIKEKLLEKMPEKEANLLIGAAMSIMDSNGGYSPEFHVASKRVDAKEITEISAMQDMFKGSDGVTVDDLKKKDSFKINMSFNRTGMDEEFK